MVVAANHCQRALPRTELDRFLLCSDKIMQQRPPVDFPRIARLDAYQCVSNADGHPWERRDAQESQNAQRINPVHRREFTASELQTAPKALGSPGQQTPHPLVDWCWSLRVFLVRVSDPVFVHSQHMAERDLLFLGPMTMLIRSAENDRDADYIESRVFV